MVLFGISGCSTRDHDYVFRDSSPAVSRHSAKRYSREIGENEIRQPAMYVAMYGRFKSSDSSLGEYHIQATLDSAPAVVSAFRVIVHH